MIISSIVAMAPNRVIGDQTNNIPWYLPADLKFFKIKTTGHHIIMGRKCYESIGKPLPNRTNIVITRDPFFMASSVLVSHSISEALEMAYENGEQEAFIIGGGQIYELSKDLWDMLYMTRVDIEAKGNILFPKLDYDQWELQSSKSNEPDAKNEFAYTFEHYKRKP